MNSQAIEKATGHGTPYLEVHSIFYTIQGEGPFAGTPAVFVRLAGCNLQCPLCDTDYTSKRLKYLPEQVRAEIHAHASREHFAGNLVVITGGEPFRQANLGLLVDELLQYGHKVQIETNGTLYQKLDFEHPGLTVVCSPKTGKVHPELEPWINAFKYVLHADQLNPEDGLPLRALDHTAHPQVARPSKEWKQWRCLSGGIYVQPVDVGDEVQNRRHLDATVQSAMRYNYRLCLQQHKIIGLE